jgi:hypothetical protein
MMGMNLYLDSHLHNNNLIYDLSIGYNPLGEFVPKKPISDIRAD